MIWNCDPMVGRLLRLQDDVADDLKALQVRRVAGDDWFLPLPGEDHHGRVDDIRGIGGPAEFSAGTGKLRVKRYNLNFLAPQESP